MPVRSATLFRAFVLLAMAAHVFYMYCMARSMGETFGFAAVTFVKASLFSLLMLIPLFWAAAIADAPQIAARVRRQRRWRGDACPGCGYPRQGAIDAFGALHRGIVVAAAIKGAGEVGIDGAELRPTHVGGAKRNHDTTAEYCLFVIG